MPAEDPLPFAPLLALACGEPSPPGLPPCRPQPAAVGASRRVLLVSVDTARADRLDGWALTPAIGRFSAGSRRWTQARAHAPWTKPSMTTAMSSLLPAEHGVTGWRDALPEDVPTLVTALHDAGFVTEAYVSHTALVPDADNFDVGFDRYELSWDTALDHEHLETSTRLTDLALEALGRLRDEDRSLLWVHYADPHDAYLHHDEHLHLGDDEPSVYDEEIAWTDHQLARLLAAAEDDPDLAIVLLTDHGEELGDHGGWGHAHTLYDEVVRVALVVRAPGLAPAACPESVGLVDLAPTVLALTGVAPPEGFRGRSLLAEAEPAPVPMETRRASDLRGLVRWPHKVIWHVDAGYGELYDLAADPREQDDRWEAEDELADELFAELAAIWPEVVAPEP